MPVTHLEARLSTKRTLDIFTMQPKVRCVSLFDRPVHISLAKVVRLQMNPPSLTFTRELKFSGDVTISFTPQATGKEVVHLLGHIFILSDLFLVCERITPEDKVQLESDEYDMWLCYPPLSGKVLRLLDVEDNG
jgi:hypothetical protein